MFKMRLKRTIRALALRMSMSNFLPNSAELGRKLDIDILKAKALIVLFNLILNITKVNHKVFLIVFQHIQVNARQL